MIVCAVLALFYLLGRFFLADSDSPNAPVLTFEDYFPGSTRLF